MRRYETICIIRPNLSEDEITAVIERTTSIIEQFGGNVVQLDRWGLKKLAYLINKQTQGYYVYIEYAGVPDAVSELERLFRIDDKVLKYMTIKTQEEFTEDYDLKKAAALASKNTANDNVSSDDDDDDDDSDES